MASSYRIFYPDVPKAALVVTPSAAFDEDYPFYNTFYGERLAYGQLAANASSVSLTYDLGTGNSRTVDHFVLGGAAVLRANGVTQATLQGSTDGSTWINQLGTAAGFQTRTFNGPDGDDLVFVPGYNDQYAATLSAYRYWKVTLAGGTHKFPVSKIAFGASFDIASSGSKEPDYYDLEVSTEKDADTWKYTRGHVLMTKAYFAQHKFFAEWDNASDAKATEVMTTLLSNPFRHTVFVFTDTYTDPLYENKLAHCKLVAGECSIKKKPGQSTSANDVRLVFKEMS